MPKEQDFASFWGGTFLSDDRVWVAIGMSSYSRWSRGQTKDPERCEELKELEWIPIHKQLCLKEYLFQNNCFCWGDIYVPAKDRQCSRLSGYSSGQNWQSCLPHGIYILMSVYQVVINA